MTEADEKPPTKVPCPECQGRGFVGGGEGVDGTTRGRTCDVCGGDKYVTPAAAAAWRRASEWPR